MRNTLNNTARQTAMLAITVGRGVPQSNFSRRKITLRYAASPVCAVPVGDIAHMIPKCPACGRQVRRGDLHRGSLACPWCKEKLYWPGPRRLELSVVGAFTIIAAFLISYRLRPQEYAPLYVGMLIPILSVGFGAAWGLVRGFLFPRKLKRDAGWPDEGTILPITTPPEPPRES